MSAVTGDHLIYFVLAMAVIVAVTSSVRHEGDPTQALQSWLQTTFAPEAGADAGAIGENSQFPVPLDFATANPSPAGSFSDDLRGSRRAVAGVPEW